MTPSRLDEIAARLEKATQQHARDGRERGRCWHCAHWVEAKTDLAYLLARLKKAEAVCEAIQRQWNSEGGRDLNGEIIDALTTWQEVRG